MDGADFVRRLGKSRRAEQKDQRLALAESGSSLMVQSHNYLHSGRSREVHCLNAREYALCGKLGEEPGLFNHVADPDLEQDLSAQHPGVKRRLLAARQMWPAEQARERSARSTRFKLVERPLLQGGYRTYLFDLLADPAATSDVQAKFPAEAAHLQETLNAWASDLPAYGVPERSNEDLASLRALGYIN
jgi:hypothetical protein